MKNRDLLFILLLASAIFFIGNYGKYFYQTFQITFNEWFVKRIYTEGIYDITEESPKIYIDIAYKLARERDAYNRPSFFPTGYYVVKEGDKYIAKGYIPIQSGWRSTYDPDTITKTITITLPKNLEKGIHKLKIYLIQGSRGFWRAYDEYDRLRKTDTMLEIDAIKPYLTKEPSEYEYKYGISFKTLWTEYIDWEKLIQAMEEHKRIDSLAYAYDNVTLLICHGEPNAENCGIKQIEEKIVYRDCRDVGCPEGFECKEYNGTYVCIKEAKEIDYSLITIGIIFFLIIALIVLKIKRII